LQRPTIARHIITATKENAMTLLSVPDMSCGHCKASVEAALTPLAGMAAIGFPATAVA
jgi:copper chaperone CopZ